MTKTINGLTVTTSAAAGDLLPIWRAANNDTCKITKANFMGGVLTGAGTIATGGFTLTVGGTSTINGSVVGNMTGSGTVATGGNTLTVSGTSTINGSLVGSMTGSGTVATGGFTLTVPATGTASLLGTAQTYSALKTFSAGIAFANETLSTYDEGTWTPAITGSTTNPTVTYTTQVGKCTRIGNCVFYNFFIRVNTYSGGSGNVVVSLPFAAAGTSADGATAAIYASGVDFGGTPASLVFQISPGAATGIFIAVQDNGTRQFLDVAGVAAGDDLQASGFYWTS